MGVFDAGMTQVSAKDLAGGGVYEAGLTRQQVGLVSAQTAQTQQNTIGTAQNNRLKQYELDARGIAITAARQQREEFAARNQAHAGGQVPQGMQNINKSDPSQVNGVLANASHLGNGFPNTLSNEYLGGLYEKSLAAGMEPAKALSNYTSAVDARSKLVKGIADANKTQTSAQDARLKMEREAATSYLSAHAAGDQAKMHTYALLMTEGDPEQSQRLLDDKNIGQIQQMAGESDTGMHAAKTYADIAKQQQDVAIAKQNVGIGWKNAASARINAENGKVQARVASGRLSQEQGKERILLGKTITKLDTSMNITEQALDAVAITEKAMKHMVPGSHTIVIAMKDLPPGKLNTFVKAGALLAGNKLSMEADALVTWAQGQISESKQTYYGATEQKGGFGTDAGAKEVGKGLLNGISVDSSPGANKMIFKAAMRALEDQQANVAKQRRLLHNRFKKTNVPNEVDPFANAPVITPVTPDANTVPQYDKAQYKFEEVN